MSEAEQKAGGPTAPTYRQRLTVLGVFGVSASLLGPLWVGIVWANIMDGGRYGGPSPFWLIPGSILTWAAFPMLLVGREYYDASRQVAEEAERDRIAMMTPAQRAAQRDRDPLGDVAK